MLKKWGETIFYTKELKSEGSVGKVNNESGIPGNYVYKLRCETLDGRTQTKTGLFMLLNGGSYCYRSSF